MLQPQIYRPASDNATMMMVLSGLSVQALKDAAIERQTGFELFCIDHEGPQFADCYAAFSAMLARSPLPMSAFEDSALNGLTLAQFYLVFAWQLNDFAYHFLSGTLCATELGLPRTRLSAASTSAASAAKCIAHAKLQMATEQDVLAQRSSVQDED